MIEKSRRPVDGGSQARALLADLSKAFDCIDHELLIAKLYAYCFYEISLYFINSYLKGKIQRAKIYSSYSVFAEILLGVSQGSILGPLLFKIYICDLFFKNSDIDIANCADDNTPIPVYQILIQSSLNFRKTPAEFLDGFITTPWFPTLESLIVISKENLEIQVLSCSKRNEDSVKLLGIYINSNWCVINW